MGGGNSKGDKPVTIKAQPAAQSSSTQFAAPQEKGPSSKPNFSQPSPAQSVSSKVGGLQRNESQEMDGQTPKQQANQMKMQVAQTALPAAAVSMSAPSPAQSTPKKAESKQDRNAMLQQQKRDMDLKKQRQLEEEKVRKLQLINEQQKAKKAAESAAKAAEETRKKQAQKQQKNTEVFAQHQDTQGRQESQSNSEINSPPKRGQRKNDDNVDLSVNGARLNRADSKPAMAVAPVAQVQFKVVQYNPDNQQNIGGNPWANESKSYNQGTIDNSTPIHFGVMNQNNSKNDQEADRNINVGELNELLGI